MSNGDCDIIIVCFIYRSWAHRCRWKLMLGELLYLTISHDYHVMCVMILQLIQCDIPICENNVQLVYSDDFCCPFCPNDGMADMRFGGMGA